MQAIALTITYRVLYGECAQRGKIGVKEQIDWAERPTLALCFTGVHAVIGIHAAYFPSGTPGKVKVDYANGYE